MRGFKHLLCSVSILASACSGGGSSGGGGASGPSGTTPTPATPTPTPATPTPTPSPTATLSYLHSYAPILAGGGAAAMGLVRAGDGNYYGVKAEGGPNRCRPALPISCGAIIKVTPGGDESIFYAFGSVANDGYSPSKLIVGKDGSLYGVTGNGGIYDGGGTLFRITLSGTYTSLYSFGASASDGLVPTGLIQGSDGNFYGTTSSGGAYHCSMIPQAGSNCGTVFKVTPAGVETILHSFGSTPTDGIEPVVGLTEGDDGNFYGVTVMGGTNICGSSSNCGTVFRVTPTGNVTILHSFGGSTSDGIAPLAALIKGNDGAFYGTTVSGGGGRCGGNFGCGTIFRITTGGTLTILYAFSLENRLNGDGPSSLLLGRDGNFYGTTTSGGAKQCDSCGSVFRLTPTGTLTTLYSFGPVNETPTRPYALTQGSDGAFYGRNDWGITTDGSWTAFKLVVN